LKRSRNFSTFSEVKDLSGLGLTPITDLWVEGITLKVLHKIRAGCFKALFFLAGFFVLAVFIAHSGLLPDGHRLTMLTFVQPLWTVPFALFGWLAARSLRWIRLGRGLVIVQLISLLFYEDYTIPQKMKIRPTPLILPSIRVMAWNVQYYDSGIEPVLAAIKAEEPDVVLLSEHVLRPSLRPLFELMAYPYRVVSSALGDAAILTRLPILESEEVELPSRQTNLVGANLMESQVLHPRRSFIRVKVGVNGVPVDVISVRFVAGRAKSESPVDTIPWGIYLWETQRREVKSFTQYMEKRGNSHYIFGGDLNAPPASWTIRQMKNIGRDTYLDHHWYGDYTFRSKIFRFQKKKNMPMIRLDYIFASPELATEKIAIKKISLSDHDALVGDFMIPRLDSH
jgi:endonuclease/exonuclease/phosphatase (EEP) superfamily protein YafD